MDAKTIKNYIKRGLDCLIESMDILKVNVYFSIWFVAAKLLNTENLCLCGTILSLYYIHIFVLYFYLIVYIRKLENAFITVISKQNNDLNLAYSS